MIHVKKFRNQLLELHHTFSQIISRKIIKKKLSHIFHLSYSSLEYRNEIPIINATTVLSSGTLLNFYLRNRARATPAVRVA